MTWHWLDLSILIVLGLSILTGLFRGFIKETLALCIWILAIWLAYHYSPSIQPWLSQYVKDAKAQSILAFILIMLAVLIVGGLMNSFLGLILRHSGLSAMDRILGMGFGFIRGVFLVSLMIVVLKLSSMPMESYRKESRFLAHFDPVVVYLESYVTGLLSKVKQMEPVQKFNAEHPSPSINPSDIVPAVQ